MRLTKSYLELYRSRTKDGIVGNGVIIDRIFNQVEQNQLVNMIFTGISGIGKTTTAEAIARHVLKEQYHTDCVIFNCSDKTGVDNVRQNIIETAKFKPQSGLRIFIMEEAEELSSHAQNALKKPLEAPFDKSNRFIFLCNDISKISPALKDRCRIYYFMPIRVDEMIPRLELIAKEQKIDINKGLIKKLADISNGSMRFPIIQLEEFKSLNRKITEDDIRLEEKLNAIKNIFNLLKNKKIPLAKDKLLDLYQKGHYFNDIIRYFHDFTINSLKNDVNFRVKANVLIKIAETERNVKDGCNEFIQLTFLLSNISLLLQTTN